MKRAVILSAAVLWSTAGSGGEPIDRRIDAGPGDTLEISSVSGDIVVQGWDENAVHVTGELSENAERLDVLREGSRIIVRVVYPDGQGQRSWEDTDLSIRAPRQSALEVEAVSADISVSAMEGEQRLTVVSGDVITEAGSADVNVRTVSGEVSIRGRDAMARTDVSAISGEVALSGISGEISVQSVSGESMIDSPLLTNGRLQSVTGDIVMRAQLADDAQLTLSTQSGDIEFLAIGTAAARYRLSSFTGDIENCFGPSANQSEFGPQSSRLEFDEGDSDAVVTMMTMSGDIELCREN